MKKLLLSALACAAAISAFAGDGTKENPYLPSEVIGLGVDYNAKDVYVKGYIVGCIDGKAFEESAIQTSGFTAATNLVLSDNTVADVLQDIPVQLPKGDVRDGLNLVDNPSNYMAEVLLKGEIIKYFGVPGLKNTSEFTIVTPGVAPEEPTPDNGIVFEASMTTQESFDAFSVVGDIPEGLTNVWFWGGENYGAKATAYANNTRYASDVMLVSPVIDLAASTSTTLSFEQAGRFFGEAGFAACCTLNVCEEGTEAWTPMEWTTELTGENWNFVATEMDLSAYDGKKIQLGFRYTSTETDACTWEVKNIVVKGDNGEAPAEPGFIYLVGSPAGWMSPDEANAAHYADWRMNETAAGSKVYTATFEIPADPYFRFYTALTGWDADSYGSQADDNPIEYPDAFAGDKSFTASMVKGKGSFSFPGWTGGMMTITVDMSDMNNITLTIAPGDVQVATPRYIYLVGSPEGWTGPEEANAEHYNSWRLVDPNESGIYSGTFDMGADPVFRFYSALTGWDADSMGAQVDDNAVECSLTNGTFAGTYVAGKGSWSFPGFSGKMTLTVDTNTKNVSFAQVQE